MELWISTHNDGKLTEFKELFQNLPLEVHGAGELGFYSAPPETGESFLENARIKAKALSSLKNDQWVVADDSGLVVSGLNGLPGIHSARYAGDNAGPQENNAKLLKMIQLRCSAQRDAYFHCCLVALSPQGEEFVFEGQLQGKISKKAQGTQGFGYDPVFIPEGFEQTLAELAPGEKNKISHRYQAMKMLSEKLASQL